MAIFFSRSVCVKCARDLILSISRAHLVCSLMKSLSIAEIFSCSSLIPSTSAAISARIPIINGFTGEASMSWSMAALSAAPMTPSEPPLEIE